MKHVLISGGSKGLGLATVRALIAEGYRVSTFSRSGSGEIDTLVDEFPSQVRFCEGDLADTASLKSFVDSSVAAFGAPYGLINNSAIAVDGVLATLPEVEILRMVNVNLSGSIILSRLCVRKMLQSDISGRIINITSIVGIRGFSGLSVYAATKAGLDGFTRGLAREVGRRKITVNSVLPGYMRTAMSSGLEEDRLSQIVRRTPMGRLAQPEDVTPTILFLLSEGAAFITGQSIVVDGGSSV